MINKSWILRDSFYQSFHRWPILVLLTFAGCMLGWLFSYVAPTDYRAIADVYVGLNPYRTYSDATFLALTRPKYTNLDDYKNWQMSQLEAVIFLEYIIQQTRSKLVEVDPSWNEIDTAGLREILRAEWRSAGTWSLIAECPEPQKANQAVLAWSEAATQRVSEATLSAKYTFMIDQKLQALADELVSTNLRIDELTSANDSLERWLVNFKNTPSSQPVKSNDRWKVLSTVSSLALYTPTWMNLLDQQPVNDSLPGDYINWIVDLKTHIESEITFLQVRASTINTEQDSLSAAFSRENANSLALSPNLVIEKIDITPPSPIRSTGVLIAIGGIVGILSWILLQIINIAMKARSSE